MAYRHLSTVFSVVVLMAFCVVPEHASSTPAGLSPSDISIQMASMKKDVDMMRTVFNEFLTNMTQFDTTNLANKQSVDSQLLLLKTTLETKHGALEKELQEVKTREEKQMADLSTLTNRVQATEAHQQQIGGIVVKLVNELEQQNLTMEQEQTEMRKMNMGLVDKQDMLEKMVYDVDRKLTVAMETALVDRKGITANLSSTFGDEISVLNGKQNELVKKLTKKSKKKVRRIQKKMTSLSTNIDNLSKNQIDLESQMAGFEMKLGEHLQAQTRLEAMLTNHTKKERKLTNAIKTCSKHVNATTDRLDDMADFQKKLGENLQRFERAHTRLEATLDNHRKEAEETDKFLLSQQEGLTSQHGSLVLEVNELERYINLTSGGNWPNFGKCSDISAFKPGRVLATRGPTQGYIGKDPLRKGNKYYYMPDWVAKVLTEYPSENDFIQDTNAKTYTLPIMCDGAQSQVIGGKMFCVQQNTPNVLVYDLTKLNKPVKNITLSSKHTVGFGNRCHYQWGGYSDIDVEIDEFGIYLIWGKADDNCNLVITKLNSQTLDIERNWYTSINKKRAGNAFMACGKLYVTNSCRDKSTRISYVFNTADGSVVSNPGITYNNQFGYTGHMHYDPLDKVLYVWDSGRQMQVGIV